MPVAQARVGLVTDDQADACGRGRDSAQRRAVVGVGDHQRHRRDGEGDGRVDGDVREDRASERQLVQTDDELGGQAVQQRGNRDGEVAGHDPAPPEDGLIAEHQVVERDAHQGVGGLESDVVGELDAPLPTVHHVGGGGTQHEGADEQRGGDKGEAEDQRDLAQRDGLRLALHLHVQDVDLGEAEHHREEHEGCGRVPAARDGVRVREETRERSAQADERADDSHDGPPAGGSTRYSRRPGTRHDHHLPPQPSAAGAGH